LDEAAYEAYSPIYMSTTLALNYGLSFAAVIALLVHTALSSRQELFGKPDPALGNEHDSHCPRHKEYPEAPGWWYIALLVSMMALSIIVCEAWDTKLPWWGFLAILLIPLVFTIPIGIIFATTNVGIGRPVLGIPFDCRIKCNHRACGRVYVSWETTCKYDDESFWLYDHVSSMSLH
jgi:hypothetical protein